MSSLRRFIQKMNEDGAAMQAQQEATAAASNDQPTAALPAGGTTSTQVAPSQATSTSPSTQTFRKKRDDLIAEVLARNKPQPDAAAPAPALQQPLAAPTSGLTQAQLLEAAEIRRYRIAQTQAAGRSTSYQGAQPPAPAPAATATVGGSAKSQKSPTVRKRKPSQSPQATAKRDNHPPSLFDSDLDSEEELEEEEEDLEVYGSKPKRRQQRQQQQRQQQPRKATARNPTKSPSPLKHSANAKNHALAAFDTVFATQIQVEEKKEDQVNDDKASGEEQEEEEIVVEEDIAQPAAPHHPSPDAANLPLLPPPASEYRLRLDEHGNELTLEENEEEEAYLDLAVPAAIAKYLRPYQRDGVKFLLQNYARGHGCLLADDMGLGKTLQTIAFLSAVLGKSGDRRVDIHHPQLPKLERLKHTATVTTNSGEEVLDLSDEFYAPDYSSGAPILIVCPPTLIDNWGNEFEKWGTFRVIKLRSNCLDTGIASILHGTVEVGITSYEAVRNNAEKFSKVPWHVVVFDEAHKLKNPKAAQTKAAWRLPTRLRFALSGTPFTNDYEELFHLINYVSPGVLGSSDDFNDNFALKIKHGMRSDATEEHLVEGTTAQIALQEQLRPLMLRRTKNIIAHQLPKKKDNIVFCQLAPLQKRAYLRALHLPDVQLLVLKARDPCPCGSGEIMTKCVAPGCTGHKLTYEQGGVLYPHFHFCECDNQYDPVSNPTGCKHHVPNGCWRNTMYGRKRMCPYCLILPLMTILRKISLHLDLIKANPDDEVKDPIKFEWDKEVAGAIFGTDADALGGYIQSSRHMNMTWDITQSCGKLAALKGLLTKWAADVRGSGGLPHKVLIFSNSVRMLKIVQKMADNSGWTYKYLTGETPQRERQTLVDAFNAPSSNDFLFIVSTGAGGVGLNLTAANKVVILDPSYSPASDLQAMDRAFRIGQKRNVDVYRLVAAGTIEERIYMRQISKQQHSNVAVDGAGPQKRLFTGVKGDSHQKGDLWGFENILGTLLKDEVEERVEAMEVVEAADAAEQQTQAGAGPSSLSSPDGGYRIEEVPEEVIAELEAEAAAAADASGGTAAGGTGEVEDGFDPGLEAALLEEEAEEEEEEEEVLDLPGVQGIVNHSLTMAPSKKEEALRKIAVARQKATKNAAEEKQKNALAASAVAVPASALECLAAWKEVSVREMAQRMVAMSEEERTALRSEYCELAPKEGLFPSSFE